MKKRTEKVLGLLMAATMVLGMTGCGSGSGEKEPDEPQVSASIQEEDVLDEGASEKESGSDITWTNDDSVEITILMSGDATPNEDNLVLQELEKQTGTNINIIYVNGTDLATKLNTMIAGGDVPDIFWSGLTDVEDYKKAGMLADMEAVLNAEAPNVMEETKDIIREMPANKDGIYMIPNMGRSYSTNINIRTDWLGNLGLDMPTDLESFAEVMHAFTYDDPDQNGVDDTFGYSFSLSTLTAANSCCPNIFGAFGIAKRRDMVMEDGNVTTWVKHPHFLEAMQYIKRLIDDGVCEPDYVSIPTMSMFEKFWNGTSGCMEWECVGPTNNWMPGRYTENPAPEIGFTILEGPYGDAGTAANYVSSTEGWVVSADCKNMEGVARIANYLMTEEGSNLLYLGVEGVMYNWVDKEAGTIERLGEYADDAVHRANGGYCYWQLFSPASNALLRTLNKQTREGVQLAYDNPIDWAYVEGISEVYAEYGADMDQIINEMIAELLAADEADMQDIYDSYIAEWESVGGSDWETEVTALWNAQNE